MEMLWPQSEAILLSCVHVCMEVGAACIGFWISQFSESSTFKER